MKTFNDAHIWKKWNISILCPAIGSNLLKLVNLELKYITNTKFLIRIYFDKLIFVRYKNDNTDHKWVTRSLKTKNFGNYNFFGSEVSGTGGSSPILFRKLVLHSSASPITKALVILHLCAWPSNEFSFGQRNEFSSHCHISICKITANRLLVTCRVVE